MMETKNLSVSIPDSEVLVEVPYVFANAIEDPTLDGKGNFSAYIKETGELRAVFLPINEATAVITGIREIGFTTRVTRPLEFYIQGKGRLADIDVAIPIMIADMAPRSIELIRTAGKPVQDMFPGRPDKEWVVDTDGKISLHHYHEGDEELQNVVRVAERLLFNHMIRLIEDYRLLCIQST